MKRLNLTSSRLKTIGFTLLSTFGLAILCAGASSGFRRLDGWTSFWLVNLLGAGLIFLVWRIIQEDEPPRWLFGLAVAAAVLRLLVGAFWTTALPVYGYGSPVEKSGYVMKDAWVRDSAAWKLAESQKPIWKAFTQNKWADQYGGLLFLSVVIYRFLGGSIHLPLLVVSLTAAAGGAAVLLIWGFSRRLWGESAGRVAAWIAALYPEAVLLGSSQMREALIIPLAALGFYGALRYVQQRSWIGPLYILVSLAGCLLISPPFAGLILLGLLVFILALGRQEIAFRGLRSRKTFWLALVVLVALVVVGLWFAWSRIAPPDVDTPWEVLNWFVRKSAAYQTYLSRQSSGWLQREFRKLPPQFHLPMLIGYGVLRPFLPAALAAYRSPLWYGISIWRSLGWVLLFISVVSATFRSIAGWISGKKDSVTLVLCAVVWIGMLVAAARGGGDDWDNPRYRTVFFCLQAGLAGWFWMEVKQISKITTQRVAISACIFLAWFLAWYVRRYQGFSWDIISIFHTIGIAFAATVLYWIWDVARRAPQGR